MSHIKYLHIHNGGDSASRTAEVGGTVYIGLQLQGWQVESKIIESDCWAGDRAACRRREDAVFAPSPGSLPAVRGRFAE